MHNVRAIRNCFWRPRGTARPGKWDIQDFRVAKNIKLFILFSFKIFIKVLAHCVRTDVYLNGLLPKDMLLLSYPSPNFIAFCPQPKAIILYPFADDSQGEKRDILAGSMMIDGVIYRDKRPKRLACEDLRGHVPDYGRSGISMRCGGAGLCRY